MAFEPKWVNGQTRKQGFWRGWLWCRQCKDVYQSTVLNGGLLHTSSRLPTYARWWYPEATINCIACTYNLLNNKDKSPPSLFHVFISKIRLVTPKNNSKKPTKSSELNLRMWGTLANVTLSGINKTEREKWRVEKKNTVVVSNNITALSTALYTTIG